MHDSPSLSLDLNTTGRIMNLSHTEVLNQDSFCSCSWSLSQQEVTIGSRERTEK